MYSFLLKFILLVPGKLLKLWIQKYSFAIHSLSWKIRSACSLAYTVSQEVAHNSGKAHLFHFSITIGATVCSLTYPVVYIAVHRLSSLVGHAIQLNPTIC